MIFVYRNLNRVEQRKDVVRQGVFFKSPPEGGKIAALLWVFCAFSCFYSKTFNFQFNSSFLYLDWVIMRTYHYVTQCACLWAWCYLAGRQARVIIYWPICKVLALCWMVSIGFDFFRIEKLLSNRSSITDSAWKAIANRKDRLCFHLYGQMFFAATALHFCNARRKRSSIFLCFRFSIVNIEKDNQTWFPCIFSFIKGLVQTTFWHLSLGRGINSRDSIK